MPKRLGLALDELGIPTGRRIGLPAEAEALGARTFDDAFRMLSGRTLGIEGGGRRLSVLLGTGYPYAQVYAPPGASFVCLEPMTAPTNALVSGDCRAVRPGASFTARFQILPERAVR